MTCDEDDAPIPATAPDACRLVPGGASHVGRRGLHMQLVTIPPGAR